MDEYISTSPDRLKHTLEYFYSNSISDAIFNNLNKSPKNDTLEYDLRTNNFILQKVRNSENYAKRLYAALCNNEFQKNGKEWSCSWRHAGGILADMIEKGDYIDFYCSGFEGYVFEDVKQDLLKLGWEVMNNEF